MIHLCIFNSGVQRELAGQVQGCFGFSRMIRSCGDASKYSCLGMFLRLIVVSMNSIWVGQLDAFPACDLVEYCAPRHQDSQSPDAQPGSQPQPRSQPGSLGSSVLILLADRPKAKADLSTNLGHEDASSQLYKVVRRLLAEGMIEYTVPDKPRSRLQRYRVTAKGMAALATLKHGSIEG